MRLPKLWWALGAVMLAAVLVICLVPLGLSPPIPFYNDKVMHLLTFVLLAVWFGGLQAGTVKQRLLLTALLLIFSVIIEILQFFTTYRSAEFADFLADAGGVAVGLILLQLGFARWPVFIETHVFSLAPR
jgi:VanZ family protein